MGWPFVFANSNPKRIGPPSGPVLLQHILPAPAVKIDRERASPERIPGGIVHSILEFSLIVVLALPMTSQY